MEILSETTHIASHVAMLIICILITLFLLIGAIMWIIDIIRNGFDEGSELVGLFATSVLGLLVAFLCYAAISKGADVTYKATITDFNVVYEQGYKIIEQDDKIFTLEKVRK